MKAGWQFEKLGGVCSFINRGISPKYLEQGGVCVLNQKCVRDHQINYSLARRHDATAKKVTADRFIQLGDVLVNSTGTGTLGRVAQVRETPSEPTTVDSHVTIVRPVPGKFFQDFFGYMLVYIEEAIKEAGEGCGGQTELARSVLSERFSVAYPDSTAEQQRIVAILDEAFAGIATAQAAAEQNRQKTRALFESHLHSVFSQNGDGWLDRQLGDIFHIGSSKRVYEKEWTSSGVPFYGGREVVKLAMGMSPVISAAHISEEKYLELASQYDMPQAGDILMTARGTIGVGYVVKGGDRFYYKDGNIISFRAKTKTNPWFILFAFKTKLILDQIRRLTGTTVKHLPIEKAKALTIKVPDLAAQNTLVEQLERIENESQNLEFLYQRKLDALDELKKSLLHQAFRGLL